MMTYCLVLISILFGLAAAQASTNGKFGRCSCTGDPHVVPFPPAPGLTSNQYYCQTSGWQLLLQNSWVLIAIKVGPAPYVVLDYAVIFFQPGGIACILFGSGGLSTCPGSSPVISVTGGGGTSWNHLYPLAEFLDLQITSYPWAGYTRYDIIILETFDLISQSTGICIKNNCPLERVLGAPLPAVNKICEAYVGAAQQRTIGPVTDDTVNFATTACLNDLTATAHTKFAQTAVVFLIHSSLDGAAGEGYQDAVAKAQDNIDAAILEGDSAADSILAQEDTCFDQKLCLETNNE